MLNLSIEAPPADVEVILELLSPWDISFSELDEADITIVHKQKPSTTKASVIIPSDSASFIGWVKETGLEITRKTGYLTPITATSQTTLMITPKTQYCFGKSMKVDFEDETPIYIQTKDDRLILKLDLVQEYRGVIDGILHPEQSTLHRVVTGLPIPYGLAPKRLRDYLMKADKGQENLNLCDKLPLDALRFILVNAIEKTSGEKIKLKSQFADSSVCVLTHDVETAHGLQRARILKKIEEKYDVSSAWYVPSNRYRLNCETIRELANHGEVGSHDTKHDGKLVHLKKQELVTRLTDARQTLERITEKPVAGFRAPILQHNQRILQALNEAGYLYDTSVPAWEPKHPYTMKPHGVGTVFPLTLNGIIEIPLTLPQDHQLLHVLGLAPEEVLKTWVTMSSMIQDLKGVSMFLVHPDYELANGNADLYEELVNAVTSDSQTTSTVPSRICELMKPITLPKQSAA
jgi:peptidoglycan/xylan/chitin deacetylase (PgdA/CDA1 family)